MRGIFTSVRLLILRLLAWMPTEEKPVNKQGSENPSHGPSSDGEG
jgi:hypothetical protein